MNQEIQWDDRPDKLKTALIAELILALGIFACSLWILPKFGLLISLVFLISFGYLLSKLAPHALRMKQGKQSRLTFAMVLFVPLLFGFILPLIFDSPFLKGSEGFLFSVGIGWLVGSAYLLARLVFSLSPKPNA